MKRILTLPLLIASFFAIAQNDSIPKDSISINNLDEVIVTATRTKRQLSSLPLPAQIISLKEIKKINSLRLDDILNEQTGLITVPDFGGGEGVQMQGLDSQYTLILIDGVPLIGRLAGTLDISRITVGNIKQIEIVKGASSSLYGSEAMGGVVNIITDTPKKGFGTTLDYRYSTNNTHDANIDIGYGREKYSITAYINRYSSDGYDLTPNDGLNTIDPFINYTFSSKFNYRFSKNTDLLVSGRYYTQNQDYIASETLSGESDVNEWNTQLKLNHKLNDKWNAFFEFYATRYKAEEYLNNPNGSLNGASDFNQLLIKPELRVAYQLNDKHSFISGLGFNYETLKRTDFLTDPKFKTPYLYVQYDGNPTEKLNVILGARFDLHSKYKSQFSPKAAARYKISDEFSVKGSVGYGFKAPDFRQLYFDFTNSSVGYTVLGYNAVSTRIPEMVAQGLIANLVVPITEFEDELKPENSVGINFGGNYNPTTTLSFNVNFFRNNIQDLIDTRVIANKTNGQNVFSYYNINKFFTQGLEFNASYKPSNQLKFSAGYQLLYAKDKEAIQEFKNGNVYARAPISLQTFQLNEKDYFGLYNRSRHMINFKVFYTVFDWNLDTNLRMTYRSKYGLYDTNANNYLDKYDDFVSGYSVWNWAVNKKLDNTFNLGFGVDNIFDFTDSQNISNISGRIIYGKINIQL